MTPIQVADLQAGLADRYTVERELGRGGMATVYLANDLKHHRSVAIKVLHPEIAAAVGPERFVQEIETIAGLNHPHILPMHDSGLAGSFLYYVMPYSQGETLRDRLDREKQLPLADALKITRDVAAALDFAHEHDIVHRDVKPDNILLEGDEAVVTDFGISRAITSAGGEKLTETGLVIGTPTYMSPEQGAGDEEIDRRSDVYALGCVLYEMLAGKPPFTGASSRAIIMRHLREPPPPLGVVRPDLPPAVEKAVTISLAKAPADRYATAVELVESVTRATQTGARVQTRLTRRARRLWWAAAVVAVLAVAAVIQAVQPFGSESLDSSRYVVAPFELEDGGSASALGADEAQRLMAETLRQWNDVVVVDEHQLADVVANGEAGRMSHRAWLSASRSVDAGRLVQGRVLRLPDGSLRASASLYDVGDRSGIGQADVSIAPDLSDAAEAFRQLAGELLGLVTQSGSVPRGRSVRATQQFLNGLALLGVGEMANATDSFRAAHETDREFAAALLWHAQVTAWAGDTVTEWQAPAQAAARLRVRLTDSLDIALAEPMLDLAEERYDEACEGFQALVERDSTSYAAWFGLAECHARDHTVLRDPESTSGWRFRSSYVAAAQAYREGLEIVPFLTPGFYSRLTDVLLAQPNSLRWGRPLPPDTGLYLAYPGIDSAADTLIYVPCPAARGQFGACEPPTHAEANERNAREMLEVVQRALALYDVSARPLILTAEALELNGRLDGSSIENSSLIASRRALEVALNPDDSLAAAVVGIRVLTKLGRFEEAAALADTTLSRWTTPEPWIARQLVPIATLTGRPNRAASLGAASAASVQTDQQYRGLNLPLPVLEAHEALVAYASLGAPEDSVESLMSRLESLLRANLTETQAVHTRCSILARPTALAFSILRRTIEDEDCLATDDVYRLQFAFANDDRDGFDREWRELQERRRLYKPGEVTADHVYMEAWLLVAWGDTTAAVKHLDRSLEAMSTYPPSLLTDPAQPAGLVRAMALRAELADAAGDEATARRWSNAVGALWGSAEDALRPTVARMRESNQ